MSDTNERSVASAGSQPVSGGPITLRLSNEEQQEMLSRLSGRQSGTLLPLDLPQPTLTDEEREAIGGAIESEHGRGAFAWAATLRKLLERTK
jgi:hypothetical protein